MSNYLISVSDLDKPIIRKDMMVSKEIVQMMVDKTGGLGLIVEQLIEDIEKEKK